MPRRDPLTFPYPKGIRRLDNMNSALKKSLKTPPIGLTQGGSSRHPPGARVAATNALVRNRGVK